MPRKVFRARPKKYFGIPRHKVNPISTSHSSLESGTEAETSVEAQAETLIERPLPLETASHRKFPISYTLASCLSSGEPSGYSEAAQVSGSGSPYEGKGYRLINCESLSQAVSEIGMCSVCKSSLTLRESLVSRRGIVSKLVICCTVCDKKAVISDPYAPDAKQLNSRSVMAMRAIGRGKTSLSVD